VPLILCLAGMTAGCASLDPAEDLEQASSLVTSRVETDPGWNAPWHDPGDHWDGRSPLSADTAVRIALRNNRAIRRDVETIVASRADFAQAHLLPNPVISFAYGFPSDSGGGNPLMATVMQQLTWLWRRPATIDEAEADLRTRILAVSDAALDLVADARRAHADVLFAERAVALQERNVDLLEQSTTLLRERLSVGEASRLDVNRMELDLRATENRLVDRRRALDEAQRALLEKLGRAAAGTAWTTDDVAPVAASMAAGLDEMRVVRLAARQRLDVAAADAAVESRAAAVILAEQGRLPDVAVGVGYQRNFSNRPGVFPGIEVSPKLFDDNSARIARARSELRQAEIEADRVRQAAITEARQAWIGARAQQEVVQAYETSILDLAESNFALAREAFDAGEVDLTALLDAERRRNDMRNDMIDRQRAATALLIELERASGGSLEMQPPAEMIMASRPPADTERTREVAP
jgi:outer membrane protein TolC